MSRHGRSAALVLVPLLLLALLAAGILRSRQEPSEARNVAAAPSATVAPSTRAPLTPTTRPTESPEETRGLTLPTMAAGSGDLSTSTPMPQLPTPTPLPTNSPVPTQAPPPVSQISALSPGNGARITGPLTVRATIPGAGNTVRAQLWMGGDPLYRVADMARNGDQLSVTVPAPPNGNYGSWRFQVRLYSGSTVLASSSIHSLVWSAVQAQPTRPPAPNPPTVTPAPPINPTIPPATPTIPPIPTPELPPTPAPPTPVP